MIKEFFVYALLDPRKPGNYTYSFGGVDVEFDHEPYYIGKGNGDRVTSHFSDCSLNKMSFKNNKINKIISEGYDKNTMKEHTLIVMKTLDEDECFIYEIGFISEIGRQDTKLGTLTNKTDGGDGSSGYRHTDDAKRRISEGALGNTYNVGRVATDEAKQNISKALMGHPMHENTLKALAHYNDTRGPVSEETRAKQSESALNRENPVSEETRDKLRKVSNNAWSDPEKKKVRLENISNANTKRFTKLFLLESPEGILFEIIGTFQHVQNKCLDLGISDKVAWMKKSIKLNKPCHYGESLGWQLFKEEIK